MFVNPKRRPKIEEDPSRRVPAQERSKKRVAAILDAASVEFSELGFDAATMEGIAARAETSIGSIYQFFPNKTAIFQAIQLHYLEKLKVLFDVLLSEESLSRPWVEVLDAGVDALAQFHETEPGFRAVWLGMHLTKDMVREGEALNREFAARVGDWLAANAKHLTPKERPLVATMMVETVSAMLIQAARRGAREGRAIMLETKTLLRRYLEPYLGPSHASAKHEPRAVGSQSAPKSSRSRPK